MGDDTFLQLKSRVRLVDESDPNSELEDLSSLRSNHPKITEIDTPVYLSALHSSCTQAHSSVGWRLVDGSVICGACHRRPESAYRVDLVYDEGRPVWRELLVEVENYSASEISASPADGDAIPSMTDGDRPASVS